MFMQHAGSAGKYPTGAGDLGRRIALRRQQLGLSRRETAARAGMAETYLEYVESSPAAVDIAALTRLAGTLGTTPQQLLGGGLDLPPGRGRASTRPVLTELGAAECWARLAPGGVGRVALSTSEGPVVLPVNYLVLDGILVFRTTATGLLASAVGTNVAFEVDRLDEALSTGWSVLATGTTAILEDQETIEHLTHRGFPTPWAGGDRDVWVRIEPTAVTGRIIRTEQTPPPSASNH
ncbi:helix-turn-helix domain-containing protein [Kitasatospora sp. NPDC001175]|uniref:helix-turn-helix domain-containing protein n=1 Tax=Kitasatospora sp. NPDC001175 TaxID=3157103 RepID=UPI003D05C03A